MRIRQYFYSYHPRKWLKILCGNLCCLISQPNAAYLWLPLMRSMQTSNPSSNSRKSNSNFHVPILAMSAMFTLADQSHSICWLDDNLLSMWLLLVIHLILSSTTGSLLRLGNQPDSCWFIQNVSWYHFLQLRILSGINFLHRSCIYDILSIEQTN